MLKSRNWRVFPAAVALSWGLLAGPGARALPQEPPDGAVPPKQSLQWFEKIGAGDTVRVRNPLGNVYARFGGYEGQVEILATIQKLDPSLPELEVDRSHSENGLDITARHHPAENGTDPPAGKKAPESRDRVDLVLFVPLGAALDIETQDDSVEVKGIKSDLDVRTLKGDIRVLKVEGRVRARSERGAISVTLESDVTHETQTFATETGDIEVYLWEDAKQQASLATSGRISTDFTMEIEHRRFEEPGKYATATIGGGGPQLTLYSKRGNLSLLRLPRHYHPEN